MAVQWCKHVFISLLAGQFEGLKDLVKVNSGFRLGLGQEFEISFQVLKNALCQCILYKNTQRVRACPLPPMVIVRMSCQEQDQLSKHSCVPYNPPETLARIKLSVDSPPYSAPIKYSSQLCSSHFPSRHCVSCRVDVDS